MRIRTKISVFAISLVAAVVLSIVANLVWLEQRRVRDEFGARVDALMEGVLRIARESLSTEDELMLMSYLKFLMKDYPEIEVAIVSRQDHTAILGEVRSDVQYRTIAIADPSSEAAASPTPILATGRDLPPHTFSIQLGFSRMLLERNIRESQLTLMAKILRIAAFGLIVGILGSLWLGRLLAGSLGQLALAAERIGQGQLDTIVQAGAGDEIGDLAGQFNRMAGKLKELMRFKEDLLSTLSHELKTPLSGVKGFLEYLLESDARQTSRERRESYQTMTEAVKQMEVSLGNAMQLFKTEHEAKLQLEDLVVRDVVTEVARLFEPTARVSDIVLRGPLGTANGRARSDKELVRRLAINLVSNALKYTAPGGVVTLRLQEDTGSVLLSVQDTGPGIAPEYREHLFAKFYRVPANGHSQRIPGSGLGLAIAKQAADLLGGRIWLDSEVGKGSIFYVSIPKRGGGEHDA